MPVRYGRRRVWAQVIRIDFDLGSEWDCNGYLDEDRVLECCVQPWTGQTCWCLHEFSPSCERSGLLRRGERVNHHSRRDPGPYVVR